MTWYATEILAAANEALLDYVKTDPHLREHAYLIAEPLTYQRNDRQMVQEIPSGGLLILRPICDAADLHWVDWHGGKVLDWDTLTAEEKISVIEPNVFEEAYGFNTYDNWLPPIRFLRFLKRLSAGTQTNLVYFYSTQWGGDTDFEYAWFYGLREEAVLLFDPDTDSVAKTTPGGRMSEVKVDILSEALAYLGAPLTSSFCIFHTRTFEWDRYKLGQPRLKRLKPKARPKERVKEPPSKVISRLPKLAPDPGLKGRRASLLQTAPPEFQLVTVPAGEFMMGQLDNGFVGSGRESPAHRVTLDSFQLGRYPVTNAQYRPFVQDSGHPAPGESLCQLGALADRTAPSWPGSLPGN
jgi:hypothetical protein